MFNATRIFLRADWAVYWLGLLAGCQGNTELLKEEKASSGLASAAASAASPLPAAPAAPCLGYHRYRGAVGNQPVIVELTYRPTSKAGLATCSGSYYYERHGGRLRLQSAQPFGAGLPLALIESTEEGQPATAHWQARAGSGQALTGAWASARGRLQLPFVLQEDYTGAVRYEVVALTIAWPAASADDEEADQTAYHAHPDSLTTEFLHLLGPDTLRPALRRL